MINDIATRLKDRILILDGAMGTILQNQGMQPGDCPEWFGIQNPGLLEEISVCTSRCRYYSDQHLWS